MSLKARILEYLRQRPFTWINGGEIEDYVSTLFDSDGVKYKASNASRRLRELEDEGTLERRLNEKRCVEYRYKGIMQRIAEKPQEPKQINLI